MPVLSCRRPVVAGTLKRPGRPIAGCGQRTGPPFFLFLYSAILAGWQLITCGQGTDEFPGIILRTVFIELTLIKRVL
jgi:hypothetical protein